MAYPLAPPNNGAAVLPTDDDGGQLRPPTKLLGCLRTVGRPTSKTNPLLVAAFYSAADISRVDVKLVDVASGATVARLDRQGNGHFGATGGLLCLVGTGGTAAVSVLDPATGDVTSIPAYADGNKTSSAYVFGHVPATGEHKVLRVYTAGHGETKQSCEILTLGGGGGGKQRWRTAPSPPVRVGTAPSRHWAVTRGGVAHFLIPQRAEYDVIASFDMATEEWRPALLQCPLSSDKRNCCSDSLSLVELNGCLVFVHHDYLSFSLDMWVLTDLDRGTWLRVESLPLGKVLRGGETMAKPLMVLDDGRIAFWVRGPNSVVRVYNPRTGGCEEVVNFGKLCSVVGLYRGSLLGVK
ncbi:unnamed protein product [Miscanthus lutarioriparius]|uniref:F-box associated beta-propeller type 3 domain-containing protein n=1 Tax=Miscanthus lutarioriparius TaxID=422564 RepID=A0A811NER9_9POAL|nr:unnamed protein product [Miscanthus lutarioriparius]